MEGRLKTVEKVLDYIGYARVSEQKHITAWLVDELNYGADEVQLFWSNIHGLVDIDTQEYKNK